MAIRVLNFAAYVCLFALIIQVSCFRALNLSPDVHRHYPKVISDLKEAIVKEIELQPENVKLFGFDLKDTLVTRAMEFDLEIDNKVLPIKLLEDVDQWEYVDFPTFLVDDQFKSSNENGLMKKKHDSRKALPSLAPFQLTGPMELWIQDAKDMRLLLPHDVDAGELKKIKLADGVTVTVNGAKSVSLRHPIELPLPFNKTKTSFASGLLTLSNYVKHASRTQNQLVSLRIVGPTSLTSSAMSSNKLKLKRLAPGLAELSSVSAKIAILNDETTLLTQNHLPTFWPISSMNGSNSNLRGLETLLSAVLDSNKSKNNGSFKLLRADVSSQMFLKIGFGVEKKLIGNESVFEGYPEWRTKPESTRLYYEMLAKVDGNKVVPEKVVEVDPVMVEDTVAYNVITKNVTMSKMPIVNVPFSVFAL